MSELGPIRALSTPLAPAPRALPAAPAAAPTRTFASVLSSLGDEAARGERLVDRATRAGQGALSNGDVLALQAGVYRYVEIVDLTSKLVDRAAQSVKQVTQGQG